jgi:hypothetical protein
MAKRSADSAAEKKIRKDVFFYRKQRKEASTMMVAFGVWLRDKGITEATNQEFENMLQEFKKLEAR